MATETALYASIDAFFCRIGLSPDHQRECYAFARSSFPNDLVVPTDHQGFCSLTLFVGTDTVVQFRPVQFRLDLQVTAVAYDVFGAYAPRTEYLTTLPASNLLVYRMSRIQGISFRDFQINERSRESAVPSPVSLQNSVRACRDFARFLSLSWHYSEKSCCMSCPAGNVGKSLVPRLESLCIDLPVRFQSSARKALQNIQRIESLPWVLTHGDITPSNLIVDTETCCLNGFVDWAEAEPLPFGVCIYGLEDILGSIRTSSSSSRSFQYRSDAEHLRGIFWSELAEQIPQLHDKELLETVKLARDLGVLLWYGIAFDNGTIDRVVQEDRDLDEICKLDAFLGGLHS